MSSPGDVEPTDMTATLQASIDAARKRSAKLEGALAALNTTQPASVETTALAAAAADPVSAYAARIEEWRSSSEAGPILSTITEDDGTLVSPMSLASVSMVSYQPPTTQALPQISPPESGMVALTRLGLTSQAQRELEASASSADTSGAPVSPPQPSPPRRDWHPPGATFVGSGGLDEMIDGAGARGAFPSTAQASTAVLPARQRPASAQAVVTRRADGASEAHAAMTSAVAFHDKAMPAGTVPRPFSADPLHAHTAAGGRAGPRSADSAAGGSFASTSAANHRDVYGGLVYAPGGAGGSGVSSGGSRSPPPDDDHAIGNYAVDNQASRGALRGGGGGGGGGGAGGAKEVHPAAQRRDLDRSSRSARLERRAGSPIGITLLQLDERDMLSHTAGSLAAHRASLSAEKQSGGGGNSGGSSHAANAAIASQRSQRQMEYTAQQRQALYEMGQHFGDDDEGGGEGGGEGGQSATRSVEANDNEWAGGRRQEETPPRRRQQPLPPKQAPMSPMVRPAGTVAAGGSGPTVPKTLSNERRGLEVSSRSARKRERDTKVSGSVPKGAAGAVGAGNDRERQVGSEAQTATRVTVVSGGKLLGSQHQQLQGPLARDRPYSAAHRPSRSPNKGQSPVRADDDEAHEQAYEQSYEQIYEQHHQQRLLRKGSAGGGLRASAAQPPLPWETGNSRRPVSASGRVQRSEGWGQRGGRASNAASNAAPPPAHMSGHGRPSMYPVFGSGSLDSADTDASCGIINDDVNDDGAWENDFDEEAWDRSATNQRHTNKAQAHGQRKSHHTDGVGAIAGSSGSRLQVTQVTLPEGQQRDFRQQDLPPPGGSAPFDAPAAGQRLQSVSGGGGGGMGSRHPPPPRAQARGKVSGALAAMRNAAEVIMAQGTAQGVVSAAAATRALILGGNGDGWGRADGRGQPVDNPGAAVFGLTELLECLAELEVAATLLDARDLLSLVNAHDRALQQGTQQGHPQAAKGGSVAGLVVLLGLVDDGGGGGGSGSGSGSGSGGDHAGEQAARDAAGVPPPLEPPRSAQWRSGVAVLAPLSTPLTPSTRGTAKQAPYTNDFFPEETRDNQEVTGAWGFAQGNTRDIVAQPLTPARGTSKPQAPYTNDFFPEERRGATKQQKARGDDDDEDVDEDGGGGSAEEGEGCRLRDGLAAVGPVAFAALPHTKPRARKVKKKGGKSSRVAAVAASGGGGERSAGGLLFSSVSTHGSGVAGGGAATQGHPAGAAQSAAGAGGSDGASSEPGRLARAQRSSDLNALLLSLERHVSTFANTTATATGAAAKKQPVALGQSQAAAAAARPLSASAHRKAAPLAGSSAAAAPMASQAFSTPAEQPKLKPKSGAMVFF